MTSSFVPVKAAKKLPLHQRIIWARKRRGISQERLAAEVGTSRRHMIRIEKGLHRPGSIFRERIAEVTGLDRDFFSDEDDEEADPVLFAAALQLMFDRSVQAAVDRRIAAFRDRP